MIMNVQNGTFAYPHSEKIVLKDINLTAQDGDVLAILGPNGAGKTTLLKCIMGLLKWKEGSSNIDGRNIKEIPHKELWRKVSYVPQAKKTITSYTTEEMILLGRNSHMGIFSSPTSHDVEIVKKIMKRLHISFLKGKKCAEISGGELQMVLIARALAADAKTIILDEPESNLDFKNQLLVLDTISELASEGATCIFNTHYPAHALQRANKALMLKQGGSYIFGDTAKVVTEESIEETFGVHAVIGDIETPGNILRNVIPLSIAHEKVGEEANENGKVNADERVIAVLAIITSSSSATEKINKVLHTKSKYIIGRMGMPYKEAGVFIINLTLDGPAYAVRELTDALNLLPSVSVKATYAKDFKT